MRHVERRHHRDALGPHYFSGLADLVHLAVQVGDRLHERFPLAVLARDAVGAAEQVDFYGFRALRHQPGIFESRPSSRALALSIFSCRRFASVRAAASCCFKSLFSARRRSHSETNCATLASSELKSASTALTIGQKTSCVK